MICTICSSTKYYAKGMCNACYLKDFRKRNPEKAKQYNKANREKHGDKYRAYDRARGKTPERRALNNKVSAAWRAKNIDHDRAVKRAYYRANKDKAVLKKVIRNSRSKRATPAWLTPEMKRQISEVYRLRPVGYHVDHIIPLCGKNVSGLNVPWNLQYLPATENLKKGNR